MGAQGLWDAATLGAILDAYPSPTLVTDHAARVRFLNRSARTAFGLEAETGAHGRLGKSGDLLRCVNAAASPEGCGRGARCGDCVVRSSIARALAGERVTRARVFLEVMRPEGPAEAHFLLSAAPVLQGDAALAIVTFEDLSELVKLTSLLPICFHCRKVRDERDYWTTVEVYFKSKADIDFTHTLCDECLDKHYPSAG